MAPRGAGARRRARGRHQHRLARGADRRRARRRLALRPRDPLLAAKAATTAARSRPPAASPRRCRCSATRFWVVSADVYAPGFRFDADAAARFAPSGRLAPPVAGAEPAASIRAATSASTPTASASPTAPAPTASAGPTPTSRCAAPSCSPASRRARTAALAPLLYAGMRERRIGAEVYRGRWENVGTPEQLAALNASDAVSAARPSEPASPARGVSVASGARRSASMRAMHLAASACGSTSTAPRLTRSWRRLDAPVITVQTRGFFAAQAIASCADARAELGGDRLELGDRGVLRRVGQALGEEAHALERAAAAGRDAAAVLAGQQAARERAPGRQAEADVVVERARTPARRACGGTGGTAAAPSPACAGGAARRCPRPRGSRPPTTRWCPSRAPCRCVIMSLIAQTVSSIGVCGSGRWQKTRSTKSSCRRCSEPSIACIRYLRFSVSLRLTALPSRSRPQKNLVETT